VSDALRARLAAAGGDLREVLASVRRLGPR
jgi:hypothetical protein